MPTHLKLNLYFLLLFLPAKACPLLDLSIKIHNSVVPATCMARNLGLTLDDLLSFAANSAVISHSCRLMGQGTRDQPPQPHGLRPPTDR